MKHKGLLKSSNDCKNISPMWVKLKLGRVFFSQIRSVDPVSMIHELCHSWWKKRKTESKVGLTIAWDYHSKQNLRFFNF